METKRLAGQCYCRSITYEVADNFKYAMNCHCSNCRRTTGSAFKPMAGIEVEALRVTAGEAALVRYGEMRHGDNTNYDAHCGQCGSLLFSIVRDGQYAHVAMGTLIDDPGIRPTHHISVGSKAPWFTITDDLPQFEEMV